MADPGPRVPRAVRLHEQHHGPSQTEPGRHRLGQGRAQTERLHRSAGLPRHHGRNYTMDNKGGGTIPPTHPLVYLGLTETATEHKIIPNLAKCLLFLLIE